MEGPIANPVNASPAATRRDELTRTVERWVAQTFYGTLLRQMRNSPFKSELFDGGRGGQAFSSMLDQQLADRMARGAGGKLVRSIVRQIEGRTGANGSFGGEELQTPPANGELYQEPHGSLDFRA